MAVTPEAESIRSLLLHVWTPCLLSACVAVASLVLDASGLDSNWFQRSGVLLIIAGSYVAYHEIKRSVRVLGERLYWDLDIWYKKLALSLVLVGTLVTGYGDLLLRH